MGDDSNSEFPRSCGWALPWIVALQCGGRVRVFEWAGVALSRGGDESVRLFNLSRRFFENARIWGGPRKNNQDIRTRLRAGSGPMSGSDAAERRARAVPVHRSTYYSCTASNLLLILFYVHLALAGSLLMHSGLTTRLTMLRMRLGLTPTPPQTSLRQHHFALKAERFKNI